jgi:hypothetical protein
MSLVKSLHMHIIFCRKGGGHGFAAGIRPQRRPGGGDPCRSQPRHHPHPPQPIRHHARQAEGVPAQHQEGVRAPVPRSQCLLPC